MKIIGGLGNQLFQIFAVMAYGIKHNQKIIFPYYKYSPSITKRKTYWDDMLIELKEKYTTINDDNYTTINEDNVSVNYNERFENYKEQDFTYNEIPDFENKKMNFTGYYQSYKYFENQYDEIIDIIGIEKLRNDIKENVKVKLDFDFEKKHFISLHFRIGDYKNIQEYHYLLNYDYYNKSISKILALREPDYEKDKKISKEYVIKYFCENQDNEEVLVTIDKLKLEYPFIEFHKIDDTIEDWNQMLIMSLCNDNIIANSTFSWWGAFFNTNKDKIVCYPNMWFGHYNFHLNTIDLFPETWIKIIF
jgi:hypothetical protein